MAEHGVHAVNKVVLDELFADLVFDLGVDGHGTAEFIGGVPEGFLEGFIGLLRRRMGSFNCQSGFQAVFL